MAKRYYLAYGSNLNREQMGYRCPQARPVGVAELKDWRLLFRGSGTGNYLTIEPALGFSVPVAVWAVTQHCPIGKSNAVCFFFHCKGSFQMYFLSAG